MYIPSVHKAAEAVLAQLERVWPEAGPGMADQPEHKRLGCTSAVLLDYVVDLRMGPPGLAEHRTSRDGPCSLAGDQVEAWGIGPQHRSLPMWLQPRHLRKRTRDHRPVDVPERVVHTSFLLPRRPVEKVSRTIPR